MTSQASLLLSCGKLAEKETRFSLGLFGKPAWEIERLEGCDATLELFDEIEALGKDLSERLQWTAKIGRELLNHGWYGAGGLYDIDFYKQMPLEEAKKELRAMGLNPDELSLEEGGNRGRLCCRRTEKSNRLDIHGEIHGEASRG